MCRRQCRIFPSLVSLCTIDWFVDWPQEALLSVAQYALKPLGDEELVNSLANICVLMHKVWNPLCWLLASMCKALNKFLIMGAISIVKFEAFMANKCSKIFFDDQQCLRTLELSATLLWETQFSPSLSLYVMYEYSAVMILTCIQEPSSNFDRDMD